MTEIGRKCGRSECFIIEKVLHNTLHEKQNKFNHFMVWPFHGLDHARLDKISKDGSEMASSRCYKYIYEDTKPQKIRTR